MRKIEIQYDGKYPNLCSGHLVVTIDGVVWDFGKYCLSSGGCAYFTGDWEDVVEQGEWSITDYPEGFPEELKKAVLKKVNEDIPWGCCGGCL